MKKNFCTTFVFVLVVAFAFAPRAFAATGCNVIAAVNDNGIATVNITGTEGSTMVEFGDYAPEVTGRTHSHPYYATGRYMITASVNGNDGKLYRCHAYVVVNTPAVPTQILPQGNISGDNTANGITEGNGSPIINNSGSNNPVIIIATTSATETDQKTIIKSESKLQPLQPITQKTKWFSAWIHATLKAFENYFHTLDESWFPFSIVK